MKANHFIGLLCVGLSACGGGDGGTPVTPAPPSAPAPPASLMLSVHDVQVLTQSSSETDDPLKVNGGAGGSITGSDETSDPVSVD